MGKLIIDTPDSTFYYCGSCAERVAHNSWECHSCGHDLRQNKSFRVPADFDPAISILEQLKIFERAKLTDGLASVATAKKLQINAEGASFFYCKNCRAAVSRTELQCPNCGVLFSEIINVDSAGKSQAFEKSTPIVSDDWRPPPPSGIKTPEIQTDFNSSERVEIEYVGFWPRVGAYIIDFIILLIIAFLFGVLIGFWFGDAALYMDGFSDLFGLVLTWVYFSWWESSEKQATLGKMAISAKVIDHDGNRISFGRATGRHFGKILSGIIFGIGYLVVAFHPEKKGLHDHIADTYVIKSH